MYRQFSRKQSVRYSLGGVNFTAGFTWCAWIRPEKMLEKNIKPLFMIGTAALKGALRITGSNAGASGRILLATRATEGASYLQSNAYDIPMDEWIFVAFTKASGESKPIFYLYRPRINTWTVQSIGEAVKDPFATPGGVIWMGDYMDSPEGEEFSYYGGIGAEGAWNSVLSEANVKSLPMMSSVHEWKSLSPTGLWMLAQVSPATGVKDWSGGGANQTSNVGSTAKTGDAPQAYSRSYRKTVLATSGLVMFLPTSEITGTVAKDPSGQNPGSYKGSPQKNFASLLPRGEGSCFKAKPGGQYLEVPDSSTLDVGDNYALEAWVKVSTSAGGGSLNIMSKGGNSYYLRLVNEGGWRAQFLKSQVAGLARSSSILALDTVYHIVVCKAGATRKVYVNGVDVTELQENAESVNTNGGLVIGHTDAGFGGGEWDGWLQALAVYKAQMSLSDVIAHYEVGVSKESRDLAMIYENENIRAKRWVLRNGLVVPG